MTDKLAAVLRVFPCTLKQANDLIARLHRHHKPCVGHRFSIGVRDGEGTVRGACVVGRPVARAVDQYAVAEVIRLVTDGTPNACSVLYGAAARAAKAMGFDYIQTYTLPEEGGASLRASGWVVDGKTSGGDWNHSWRKGRRTDQPQDPKLRWRRDLNPPQKPDFLQ